jgi:hypothetical protein
LVVFDFFKDMSLYNQGIDPVKARKEREEKFAEQKANQFIFSPKMKTAVFAFGIAYLIFAVAAIINGGSGFLMFFLLSLIDIATLACLAIGKGKKTAEAIALILILAFFGFMYLSVFALS